MKQSIFALAFGVTLVSGSAYAADMRMPYKAPPPPQTYSWTGCYVNAGWGYGMLDDERSGTTFGTPFSSTSAGKGWMGTLGGGCDYQINGTPFGPVVVGAFADYDPMNIRGTYGDPVDPFQSGTQKERDAWYAGGRIGLLVTPRLLSYFEGGWTEAHISRITVSPSDALPSADPSGWFIGGGTEYALDANWLPIKGLFWRTEYRYSSYDDYSQRYIHPGFVGTRTNVNNSLDTQTITTSLVWRFNWTGR